LIKFNRRFTIRTDEGDVMNTLCLYLGHLLVIITSY
jgi:hypothetical protein